MRDLPGYYFDAARQRYFPESSRPKASSITTTQTKILKPRQQRNHKPLNVNASILQLQRCRSKITREGALHSIQSQQVASTSSSFPTSPVIFGTSSPITSLCVSHVPQENGGTDRTLYLGDCHGICYATCNDSVFAEHHLSSEITSVQASDHMVVYTSFGPSPRILVRKRFSPEEHILRPTYLHDIRAAHLHGHSLIVGAQNKAVHIMDLDQPVARQSFVTNSDVFSVQRDNHHVWTGARNGLVKLFDVRTAREQQSIGASFRHATVMHLRLIGEHQLLVATTGGSIEIFDKRVIRHFTTSASEVALPVQSFEGHVTVSRLGLAMNPSEEYLWAAGDDKRIRAWSIRTGERLQPSLQTDWIGLLSKVFPFPVSEIVVSSDGRMDTLWVATGNNLEHFDLGTYRSQPDLF